MNIIKKQRESINEEITKTKTEKKTYSIIAIVVGSCTLNTCTRTIFYHTFS